MLGTLGPGVRTMYLCGIDELAKLAPDVLQNYGAICVCRFSDDRAIKEARKIRRRSGGQVYVAEDKDIIHTSLATANSTRVRKLLMQGGKVTELVGPKCLRYVKRHQIGRKLSAKTSWTAADRDIESLFGHDDDGGGGGGGGNRIEWEADTHHHELPRREFGDATLGSSRSPKLPHGTMIIETT